MTLGIWQCKCKVIYSSCSVWKSHKRSELKSHGKVRQYWWDSWFERRGDWVGRRRGAAAFSFSIALPLSTSKKTGQSGQEKKSSPQKIAENLSRKKTDSFSFFLGYFCTLSWVVHCSKMFRNNNQTSLGYLLLSSSSSTSIMPEAKLSFIDFLQHSCKKRVPVTHLFDICGEQMCLL